MSIKISELPAATSVGDNDVLPIVQSGTTKKATASLVKTTISGTINSSSTNDTAAGSKAVYDYSAPKSHATSGTTYGVGTSSNYGHCKTINNLTSASYTAGYALSAYQGKILNDAKEDVSNKTNTIDENSTSTQYPNAEATYQALSAIEGNLNSQIITLQAENQLLKSQIPTYTANGNTINVKDSSNLPIKDFAILGNASQNGTPTPDSPVPIQVVTGDNILTFTGKNLWGIEDITKTFGTVGSLVYADNIFAITGPGNNTGLTFTSLKKILLKGTYTISSKVLSGSLSDSSSTKASFQIRDTSNNIIQRLYLDNANVSETFTINDTTEIVFYYFPKNTTTFTNYKVQIQLEKGSIATDFEPFTSQTQLISLGDIELAKIGDYADRIYKSGDKWYLEKNIAKYVLNGDVNETWTVQASGTSSWFYQHQTGQSGRKKAGTTLLSNYYEYTSSITTSNTTIGINNMNISSSAGAIRIRYGTEDTADNYKTWLSTHNLIAYMVPETPTTTEITDTTLIQQLDNVLAMNTYKNETNAFSIVASGNAEANLQIEYYQDIQTLINNLNNAIVSLGNNT